MTHPPRTFTFTTAFHKQYRKLPKKIQAKFDQRFQLFVSDPQNSLLRIHALTGKYQGFWSLDVTGDYRALYQHQDDEVIIFGFIGTHSQLYG